MTASVFAKKNVPLDLLALISDDREFHRQDFISVQATVKPGVRLYEFDHYFDRIVELAATLESARHI